MTCVFILPFSLLVWPFAYVSVYVQKAKSKIVKTAIPKSPPMPAAPLKSQGTANTPNANSAEPKSSVKLATLSNFNLSDEPLPKLVVIGSGWGSTYLLRNLKPYVYSYVYVLLQGESVRRKLSIYWKFPNFHPNMQSFLFAPPYYNVFFLVWRYHSYFNHEL